MCSLVRGRGLALHLIRHVAIAVRLRIGLLLCGHHIGLQLRPWRLRRLILQISLCESGTLLRCHGYAARHPQTHRYHTKNFHSPPIMLSSA